MFTDVDEELVVGLAAAAGVAIETPGSHARVHDSSSSRTGSGSLAICMTPSSSDSSPRACPCKERRGSISTDPTQAAERVERAIDDLDVTSKHIRTVIFDLEASRSAATGLRRGVLEVVRETKGAVEPRVVFEGLVDAVADDALAADVLAVVREALTNVVKHANASSVDISVSVGDALEVVVVDDGIGPPSVERVGGHGVKNLRSRAEAHDGSFELRTAQPHGCDLRWSVPLPA